MNNNPNDDNEVRLYSLLVDELFRHQNIIWQIPTALLVANFFIINVYQCQPFPLVALLIFNTGLISVLYQMIRSQYQIIKTIDKSEKKLESRYSDFLPRINVPNTFKYKPKIFLWILIGLQLAFASYILLLLFDCMNCNEILNDHNDTTLLFLLKA